MKHTMRLTAIVLAVLTVSAVIMLMKAQRDLTEAERLTAELTAELQSAENENRRLTQKLEKLGTEEATEALARERLGLVLPDEIIFTVLQNDLPENAEPPAP